MTHRCNDQSPPVATSRYGIASKNPEIGFIYKTVCGGMPC